MITSGKVVTLHYVLRDSESEIIDQSEPDQPLSYLHGAQNIVPGLEIALEGKSVGDELDVTVNPEDGYGELDPDMQVELPRTQFEPDEELEVGAQFEMEVDGHYEVATITDIHPDRVIADFNHPLAGQTLFFSVSILDVRDASETELSHGHVHGVGGHDH